MAGLLEDTTNIVDTEWWHCLKIILAGSGEIMSRRFSIVLILAGLLLIALGLRSGDVTQVLIKAQRVCLECIGIG